MEYLQASLHEADRHTLEGSYGAAQNILEEVVQFCREFRDAQTAVVPGQRIPLADRLMVANHFLSISLEPLGDVHMQLGHVDEAVACLSELIEALEVVLRYAHGDSAELEARLAQIPGLHVAGNAYQGIGIPDCIRMGKAAAEKILAS